MKIQIKVIFLSLLLMLAGCDASDQYILIDKQGVQYAGLPDLVSCEVTLRDLAACTHNRQDYFDCVINTHSISDGVWSAAKESCGQKHGSDKGSHAPLQIRSPK